MALITMQDIEKLSPVFKGRFGHALARFLLRLTGVDEIDERYTRREKFEGPDFTRAYIRDLDLDYEVEGLEHLETLKDKPFITVSNHPLGALDGVVLVDIFAHFREDYKVMANGFLSLVKTMRSNFISVVPSTDDTSDIAGDSLRGVREALLHVREGHPLGIFPSGAVSDYSLKDRCVRDREWQDAALRLIRKLQVPVVPVRFFDRNSRFFYFLGLISWKIRVLRLPREVLGKKGKTLRIGIGEPIGVELQRQCSRESFGQLLRDSVYKLK